MTLAEATALMNALKRLETSRRWMVTPNIADASFYVTDDKRQVRYDYPWQFILEVMLNIAMGNMHGTTTPNA